MIDIQTKTSKRRWFRISLRLSFVLLTIVCVWLAFVVRSARRQESAAREIERVGGVGFSYLLKNYGSDTRSKEQTSWAPQWLRDKLGPHFFFTVQAVGLGSSRPNSPIKVDDETMKHVARLPELREVMLMRTNITDAGLVHLEECQQLHYLVLLRNRHITDEGMKSVKKLTKLHTLQTYGPNFTDAGLKQIKDLPNLKELMLIGPTPGITDEGVKHIAEMTPLTMLLLESPKITDEGLLQLAHLRSLQTLTLRKTGVTKGGVRRLQRALPKCKISVK